jgi:alpha-tubulin suppressor-like RCC1 family protein
MKFLLLLILIVSCSPNRQNRLDFPEEKLVDSIENLVHFEDINGDLNSSGSVVLKSSSGDVLPTSILPLDIEVDDQGLQYLRLRNTERRSSVSMSITEPSSTVGVSVTNNCPVELKRRQSCYLVIEIDASSIGQGSTASHTISINGNDYIVQYNVIASTKLTPEQEAQGSISLTPTNSSAIDFGTLEIDQSEKVTKSIQLTNQSRKNVPIVIDQSGLSKIQLDQTCGATLDKRRGCTIFLTLDSNGEVDSTINETLTISGQTYNLTGILNQKTPAEIEAEQLAISENALEITPSDILDLGVIEQGKIVVKSIRILNQSREEVSLNIDDSSLSEFNASSCPSTLKRRQSCFLNITYDANAALVGFKSENISVVSSSIELKAIVIEVGGEIPVEVPEVLLSAKYAPTIFNMVESTAVSWGYNSFGQFGLGDTINRLYPVDIPYSGAKKISVMDQHTCAIMSDDSVKCSGLNNFYQLGDGTDVDKLIPTTIPGFNGAKDIAVGSGFTCAIMSDDSVKCVGRNHYGQLGDGSVNNIISITDIPSYNGASRIYSADFNTCALMIDKTLKCAGFKLFTPAHISTPQDSGLTNVKDVVLGNGIVFAILEDGRVFASGTGNNGRKGDGLTTEDLTFKEITALNNAKKISSLSAHTCAIMSDDSVKCVGLNSSGQLGDGTTTQSTTFLELEASGSNVSDIAVGTQTTCLLYKDSTVKCTGSNFAGQLGNATTDQSLVLNDVLFPSPYIYFNSSDQIKTIEFNPNTLLTVNDYTTIYFVEVSMDETICSNAGGSWFGFCAISPVVKEDCLNAGLIYTKLGSTEQCTNQVDVGAVWNSSADSLTLGAEMMTKFENDCLSGKLNCALPQPDPEPSSQDVNAYAYFGTFSEYSFNGEVNGVFTFNTGIINNILDPNPSSVVVTGAGLIGQSNYDYKLSFDNISTASQYNNNQTACLNAGGAYMVGIPFPGYCIGSGDIYITINSSDTEAIDWLEWKLNNP